AGAVQADGLGHIVRHHANLHTNATATDLAVFFQLVDHTHGFIDGDGQRNTHETTALGNNLGIHAHHTPLEVDERTTRVARVHGDVRLDERQVVAGITVDGTDNTGRNGGFQTERRTDGQHPLPLLEVA